MSSLSNVSKCCSEKGVQTYCFYNLFKMTKICLIREDGAGVSKLGLGLRVSRVGNKVFEVD